VNPLPPAISAAHRAVERPAPGAGGDDVPEPVVELLDEVEFDPLALSARLYLLGPALENILYFRIFFLHKV
jgi:hypothetical protein